jgi:hypothetical protein
LASGVHSGIYRVYAQYGKCVLIREGAALWLPLSDCQKTSRGVGGL